MAYFFNSNIISPRQSFQHDSLTLFEIITFLVGTHHRQYLSIDITDTQDRKLYIVNI